MALGPFSWLRPRGFAPGWYKAALSALYMLHSITVLNAEGPLYADPERIPAWYKAALSALYMLHSITLLSAEGPLCADPGRIPGWYKTALSALYMPI